MTKKKIRVAVIAPPWLALPIKGYGGIELVLEGLLTALKARDDVEVELFANGQRTMRGITTHSLFKKEQFDRLYDPFFESYPIIQAHLQFAYNKIKAGNFDIIHDHVPHVGPAFWALATKCQDKIPPVLHTFHGPPFVGHGEGNGAVSETIDLEQMTDFGSLYISCISEQLSKTAPANLKRRLLPAVHNAINVSDFPYVKEKRNYFVTLARFAPYKGHHIAVEAAIKKKKRLRMAGTIADIGTNRKLLLELANPLSRYRNDEQFKYYSDKILPNVIRHRNITYSGNLSGKQKMKFIAEAKALLFPITWDEPFGMSVIEALACGTPVIAMNRGAMPEIIQHGVNGFLANDEEEFAEYMERIDEISPAACLRSVKDRFSNDAMADNYMELYREVIEREKQQ